MGIFINKTKKREKKTNIDQNTDLSLEKKLDILNNTIDKIIKYYEKNMIVNTSEKQFIVKPLKISKRVKKLFDLPYIFAFVMNIEKDEVSGKQYFQDIYIFAIDYHKLRKSYSSNREIIKILMQAIKSDSSKTLMTHFSDDLTNIINFHSEIQPTQLAIYFVYQNVMNKQDKNTKQVLDTYYELFFIIFDHRIKQININTSIFNPYE